MTDEQNTDFEAVRASICEILGLDPSRLTGLESLHVDTAAVLRFVIDDLVAAASAGRTVDVNKLKLASEALAPLLPPRPPPARARKHMSDAEFEKWFRDVVMAKAIEATNEHAPEALKQAAEVIAALSAENAQLRAELDTVRGALPPAPPSNVMKFPKAEPWPTT
jgi:hypothetical protein